MWRSLLRGFWHPAPEAIKLVEAMRELSKQQERIVQELSVAAQRNTESTDARLAILIDADNSSHNAIEAIIRETGRFGVATTRRIYADW